MRKMPSSWSIYLWLPVTALFVFCSCAATVRAQDEAGMQVFALEQQDLNMDGQPDLTIIDCAFSSGRDLVSVYDQGMDMQWGTDWEEVTDFRNDVWVFDAGADGKAELIIVFNDAGGQVADFYDDQNSDGHVPYQWIAGKFLVTESDYWSLRVEGAPGWSQSDGGLDLNLNMTLDGQDLGVWSEYVREQVLVLDGQPDWRITVEDVDRDGAPESQVAVCLAPTPPWTINRAMIRANEGAHKSAPLPAPIFWPFLRSEERLPDHNYFDLIPSVSVNWARAMVVGAGVTGYPIEKGYHITSFEGMRTDSISNADFENPQAYYDLAGDKDSFPELHIRMHHVNAGTWFGSAAIQTPLNEIRYSWNQTNSAGLFWDYKVGLAGRHAIDSTVDIQGFRVRTIPYNELPTWVMSQAWDYATFVAKEEYTAGSSEGIYAWAPVYYGNLYNSLPLFEGNQVFDPEAERVFPLHYIGLTDQALAPFFNDILPGLRGEYSFVLDGQPYLYFSPIDSRLHLLKAQQGLWTLADGSHRVEYSNMSQDAYIDRWTYWRDDQMLEQLTFSHGWLVLDTSEQTVSVAATDVPDSLFVTLPPATHDEWATLSQQLEKHRADLDPTDFEGILARLGGPITRITGATLRDFRETPDGFRFVVGLQPHFQIIGEDTLGIAGALPGDYLVRYAGAFQSQPLTPPTLVVAPAGSLLAEPPIAYVPNRVQFEIGNEGLEDAPDVLATLSVSRNGQEPVQTLSETITSTLNVPSGQSVVVGFNWTPRAEGSWTINLEAQPSNSEAAVFEPVAVHQEVMVAAAAEGNSWQLLSAFGLVPPLYVLLLLVSIAVVGAVLGLILLRTLGRQPVWLD